MVPIQLSLGVTNRALRKANGGENQDRNIKKIKFQGRVFLHRLNFRSSSTDEILIACTLCYSGPTFAFLFSTDLQHSIRISTGLGYCVLLTKINISNPNIPVQAPFGGAKKYISQKNLLCL
jgi:hypothetical protein